MRESFCDIFYSRHSAAPFKLIRMNFYIFTLIVNKSLLFVKFFTIKDSVTFIVDGNNVRVVNSAVYALMRFQEQMSGEAEKSGLLTEEAVAEWITQSRREDNAE